MNFTKDYGQKFDTMANVSNSDNCFARISAQPLLEPLLNMHTASYMPVITYLNMMPYHTSNPWNKCPKRGLLTTGGQIPIEKHYHSLCGNCICMVTYLKSVWETIYQYFIPYRYVLPITTDIGLPAKFDTLAIVSIFLLESYKNSFTHQRITYLQKPDLEYNVSCQDVMDKC